MCYAKPGPRCSNHATLALTQAKKDYAKNSSEENRQALETAQHNYNTTPKGVKELRDVARAESDPETAVELSRKADKYEAEREARLVAYNAINGSFATYIETTREEAKIPEAYRNSPFISQKGHIGYENDDVIGTALNYRPTIECYEADLSYTVDPETGAINVHITCELEYPEDAINHVQFPSINDLDEDHRPTDEEAVEIAKGLNEEYNDNKIEIYDTSDFEAEVREDIADNLVGFTQGNYDFGFDTDKTAETAIRERIKDNVSFSYEIKDFDGFDANYVQQVWDYLYGN